MNIPHATHEQEGLIRVKPPQNTPCNPSPAENQHPQSPERQCCATPQHPKSPTQVAGVPQGIHGAVEGPTHVLMTWPRSYLSVTSDGWL